MQTFHVENESTKMCFQSVSREIFAVPCPQQGNRRGPNKSHGHSNHEATSHSEGVKEFTREGFLHLGSSSLVWHQSPQLFPSISRKGKALSGESCSRQPFEGYSKSRQTSLQCKTQSVKSHRCFIWPQAHLL